MIKDVK